MAEQVSLFGPQPFVDRQQIQAIAAVDSIQEEQLRELNRAVGDGSATPNQQRRYTAMLEDTARRRHALATTKLRLFAAPVRVYAPNLLNCAARQDIASRDKRERSLRAEINRLRMRVRRLEQTIGAADQSPRSIQDEAPVSAPEPPPRVDLDTLAPLRSAKSDSKQDAAVAAKGIDALAVDDLDILSPQRICHQHVVPQRAEKLKVSPRVAKKASERTPYSNNNNTSSSSSNSQLEAALRVRRRRLSQRSQNAIRRPAWH